MPYLTYVTSAPEAYDGFGSLTLARGTRARDSKPVRLVALRPEHAAWQLARYASGLHAACTPAEYAERLGEPPPPLPRHGACPGCPPTAPCSCACHRYTLPESED